MDGILNIYKERGYTSHDVVAKLRGILHQKKIGHTGTLDPDAVGVLPVCCGKATKVCGLLTDKEKSYRAVCRLGVETDTQDLSGRILEERDFRSVSLAQLEQCLERFHGSIMQVPPMYSALKVNGRKLYELAREGKTVEREPRPVQIYALSLLDADLENGQFTFDVTCSKGTYIRTLCHDIGRQLGCLAAMKSLVRTRVSIFQLEEALTLDQIRRRMEEDPALVEEAMTAVDALFPAYPRWQIRERYAAKLANGNPLLQRFLTPCRHGREETQDSSLPDPSEGTPILVYDENGKFKAVYQKEDNDFRVVKMF